MGEPWSEFNEAIKSDISILTLSLFLLRLRNGSNDGTRETTDGG